MTEDPKLIDKKALDSLSVAPGNPDDEPTSGKQDAGQDASIAHRLERNPSSPDAARDNALDESMDASDPPSTSRPGENSDPPQSSGFNEDDEAKRAAEKR